MAIDFYSVEDETCNRIMFTIWQPSSVLEQSRCLREYILLTAEINQLFVTHSLVHDAL